MLRYFYLITLLICIEWTFCKEYIDNIEPKLYRSRRHMKDLRVAGHIKNNKRRTIFDYDRSPVEFDVASFIQPVDDAAEDDLFVNRNNIGRNNAKSDLDFKTISGLNADEVAMKDTDMDYFETQENNIPEAEEKLKLFKEPAHANTLDGVRSDNEKKINKENDVELASPRSPVGRFSERKCVFTKMKFPFFFRNKTDDAMRKNKKKRLFSFNRGKEKKKTKSTQIPDRPKPQNKMKRSYAERLCPSCRKKYVVRSTLIRKKRSADNKVTN